jgi:hypothetical protein
MKLYTSTFFHLALIAHLVHATGPPYDAQLLHPRSGDVVYAGQNYLVTWTIDDSFSDLNLYILGGGYNVEIAAGIPNTGSWEWSVQTSWPSSTGTIYMVLNRVDWNTNDEISPFTMVSVADQHVT